MSEYQAAAQRLYKAFDQHGVVVAGPRPAWVLNFADPRLFSIRMDGPSEIAFGVAGMVITGAGWALKASPGGEFAVLTGDGTRFEAALKTVRSHFPDISQ